MPPARLLHAEFLDFLFFTQLANEQRAILFGYDVVVQALYHHLPALRGMDDAVVAVEHGYVIANASVSIEVVPRVGQQ